TMLPPERPPASDNKPVQEARPGQDQDGGADAGVTGTVVGSRVVTPTTDSIVLRVRGDLLPPDPPGRKCRYNGLYTVNLRTHELAWDFCYLAERGKRLLAAGEVATLNRALARLEVVRSTGMCPMHPPEISLTTTGGATQVYHADLCGAAPP